MRRTRSSVAADDGRDIARITVSIEATAAPPNNAPVFSEGAGPDSFTVRARCAGGDEPSGHP